MKVNNLRLFLLAVATLLPIGCSNPKAANDTNFATAVSAYLLSLESSGKFCFGSKEYPHQVVVPTDLYNALVKTGLLEITGAGERVNLILTADIYDLTPKGREAFTQGRGFCYGKPELIRIVSFTEPGSKGPYVMSRVTYSYRLRDVPSWTEAFGDLKAKFPQIEDTQTFVLTGNGWVHESLTK